MAEGYREKWQVSPREARSWYWQQTLKSLPYSVWRRLYSPHIKAIGIILLTTLVGFVCLYIWDIFAARKSAQYVARSNPSLALAQLRTLYFLIFTVGSAFIGGIMALLIFKRTQSFLVNVLLFLGPIMAVIFTDSLIRFFLADSPKSIAYFLLRISLSFPALILGAFLGIHFIKPNNR